MAEFGLVEAEAHQTGRCVTTSVNTTVIGIDGVGAIDARGRAIARLRRVSRRPGGRINKHGGAAGGGTACLYRTGERQAVIQFHVDIVGLNRGQVSAERISTRRSGSALDTGQQVVVKAASRTYRQVIATAKLGRWNYSRYGVGGSGC